MNPRRILLTGATGRLGRCVLGRLVSNEYQVKALARDPSRIPEGTGVEAVPGDLAGPSSLHGSCDGIDTVISCAGASMLLGGWKDRASFEQIDYAGNAALLFEARRAGVRRFVTVSVANPLALRSSLYVRAHERFVYDLECSGIESVVIRATGFFSFFTQLVVFAELGALVIPDEGTARTNPIHEDDVAAACVEAVTANCGQITIGGPEVFTRRRIAELAFECMGKPARILSAPSAVFQPAQLAMRILHPRLHALLEFGIAVSRVDVVAPMYGRKRLGDYLRAFVRREAR
jgi:uncharacterized protein YbjT (DUF2867 family)